MVLVGDKRNTVPSVERAVLGIHGWGFGSAGEPCRQERMAESVLWGTVGYLEGPSHLAVEVGQWGGFIAQWSLWL